MVPPQKKASIIAEVAVNVRAARLAAGLSQEALAHEAGVDRTYITQVEGGRRNVTVTVLARIAGALKIPPGRLLDTPTTARTAKPPTGRPLAPRPRGMPRPEAADDRVRRALSRDPVRALDLVEGLSLSEPDVRHAIDSLRRRGVDVWYAPSAQGFWVGSGGRPVRFRNSRWAREPR
jgi:transcriptional regulator with XRE-family HTH domain